VTNCTVTSSSGFSDLDQTACRLLSRRARFTPAKDTGGNPMNGSYSSRFTWQIPKD
jgi:protein TonB